MKVSQEILYHFSCLSCKKWWAIADFPFSQKSYVWCPWCGTKHELPDTYLTAEDFATEQPES